MTAVAASEGVGCLEQMIKGLVELLAGAGAKGFHDAPNPKRLVRVAVQGEGVRQAIRVDQHPGPGRKDLVTPHVLGNYAKSEMEPLSDLLAAIASEADWLADGDDARFMSEVALRLHQDD